jgi:hypothetical protein
MATTKRPPHQKTPTKRPPRQIWLAIEPDGKLVTFGTTQRETADDCAAASSSARVVGPYVLAERARER